MSGWDFLRHTLKEPTLGNALWPWTYSRANSPYPAPAALDRETWPAEVRTAPWRREGLLKERDAGLPTQVSTILPRLLKKAAGIGGCPVRTQDPRSRFYPKLGFPNPLSWEGPNSPEIRLKLTFLLQW